MNQVIVKPIKQSQMFDLILQKDSSLYFEKKYPDIPVPDKVPMPRPVDDYFKNWKGPKRLEFKSDLDMSQFTGNQKWQLWCLERFLNLYDN